MSARSRSNPSNKHVRFADDELDFSPSGLTLKLKLGPHERPIAIVKIYVFFERGRLPRVKVRTERPKEKDKTRRGGDEDYYSRGRYPEQGPQYGHAYARQQQQQRYAAQQQQQYAQAQQRYAQYASGYRYSEPRRRS